MEKPKFVYVTYIRTTPEQLWEALTQPEFTRRFFAGTTQECEWKKGATWRLVTPKGMVLDSGHVLEIDPPRRLVLSWQKEFKPELRDETPSRLTYEIEQQKEMVKFTLVHESDVPGSKLIEAVSNGWPLILSSLKAMLETGEPLPGTSTWPEDDACVVDTVVKS